MVAGLLRGGNTSQRNCATGLILLTEAAPGGLGKSFHLFALADGILESGRVPVARYDWEVSKTNDLRGSAVGMSITVGSFRSFGCGVFAVSV
jgi:hypothetical protein